MNETHSKGLSPRQAAFVREFLLDTNATQAAIRAGYAPGPGACVTGSRLLRNPKIWDAIRDGQSQAAEQAKLTRERIVEGLLDIAEHGRSESARVAAWTALGKSIGIFVDRVESIEWTELRRLAIAEGIDPDEAVAAAERLLRG
jgi:phage terminase small subunit